MTITVRALENSDGAKVLAIYAEAIKGPDATFDVNVPTWMQWNSVHLPSHRFVAEQIDHPGLARARQGGERRREEAESSSEQGMEGAGHGARA